MLSYSILQYLCMQAHPLVFFPPTNCATVKFRQNVLSYFSNLSTPGGPPAPDSRLVFFLLLTSASCWRCHCFCGLNSFPRWKTPSWIKIQLQRESKTEGTEERNTSFILVGKKAEDTPIAHIKRRLNRKGNTKYGWNNFLTECSLSVKEFRGNYVCRIPRNSGRAVRLWQKKAGVGSEQILAGAMAYMETASSWFEEPSGFVFRFHKLCHEKINLVFREKNFIEAQWEHTSRVFPLIFSSPQLSGGLSSDPVLRQLGEVTFHVTYKHPHSGLFCALSMLAQLVALLLFALRWSQRKYSLLSKTVLWSKRKKKHVNNRE